ncbi:MAG TPA: DsrE family protein [Steroidobacteraceae bacterium]|nr:DsrE family protein [Steroidobacteraceae bacterium]
MKAVRAYSTLLAGCLGLSALASVGHAEAQPSLPIPEGGLARNLPGAREMPDPSLIYKVVFDVGRGSASLDQPDPALVRIARYYNTLAADGVAPEHLRIVVVIHGQATDDILDSAEFRSRHQGHDNPNVALIKDMARAGIRLTVCGQAVLSSNIEPRTILPQIEVTLWALTTFTNLELRGYVPAD